MIYMYESYKQM